MKRITCAVFLAITLGAFLPDGVATDRFFSDIAAESPSKQYKVEAKSPDNEGKKEDIAFQASFVYTCRDTRTGQLLWTRKQAMGKPQPLGKNSAATYSFPEEASPSNIFVSDTGWTVIRTGWDELIAVDLTGHDRGCIALLPKAFTRAERKEYVHDTTAGPMWSGYSLWYFLAADGRSLFIVRPWWGRRVIMDLEKGKLVKETAAVDAGALAYERGYVLTELAKGVDTRQEWEREECCKAVRPILNASYLAGRIQVQEAIPFLEKLQDSPYIGSSTSGGPGVGEGFEGEVNPHSFSTFTLRQVIHLSLRRLGRAPKALPLSEFDVEYEDYKKQHPYKPKVLSVAREANADKVTKGMRAEQVLDLLGAPDGIGDETWEYDMDTSPPYSLILTWDVRHVIGIRKQTPVLWQEGFVRDKQIVE